MNSTWKRRIEQVRRRWWVVAAVTVLALAGATMSALTTPTTYVGKSTLVLSGRTPEQDAVMMVGYLTIFREPATIPRLRAGTSIPADVTFDAQTVASSPILTIEATASDPGTAQSAATAIGVAFSDDINAVQKEGIQDNVTDLERQLGQIPRVDPNGATNPYYASLQERIDAARANLADQLTALQPEAGVTEVAPNIMSALGRAAIGGLVLGVLAALGLAAVSSRVTSEDDLREKTGIEPLVELPGPRSGESAGVRRDRLRTLTNLISLEDLPKPTVIALTAGHGTWGSRNIAAELAELSARRHERAVLVYADNEPAQSRGEAGFNEALADPSRIPDLLRDGDIPSLKVLAVGAHLADRYPLATRERILAVLDELRSHGDIVLVAAPAISDGSDASLLCAAADAAILVVAAGSRAGDISAAAEALERAHAAVLGAVLIDATQTSTHSEAVDRSDVIESGQRPAHDHRSPVHTADTRPHSWSVPEQDHA
jgi:Mrp family chromosome partitioning ATPase